MSDMKRKHHLVKLVEYGNSLIELQVNTNFIANWHKPPDKAIHRDVLNVILQTAYDEGYKAARLDLKEWIG